MNGTCMLHGRALYSCQKELTLQLSALQETLDAVEAENAEKQQLGTGKNYDRSLP